MSKRLIPALALLCILLYTPLGAASGSKDPGGAWLDYEAGLKEAGKQGRLVIVDFYTTWCRDCKKMDKATFSDPEVAGKLRAGFVVVKVDAEARRDLASRFGVFGYPTVCAVDPAGVKLCCRVGYMDKDEFIVFLDYANTGAYKNKSYPEYYKSRKR